MKKSNPDFLQNPVLDGSTRFLEGKRDIGFLLIHGFTATTVEVSRLGEYLNQRGFPVMMPLLPGHGTSPMDLNSKKFHDWIDSVKSAYKEFSSITNQIITGGESMGAVLTLHLAASHPEIRAQLLYSPALDVPNLKFSRWLRYFKPVIPKKNNDDEMPWQGYTVWPLKAAFEFFKLQKIVKKELSGISTQTLILHGRFDKTIDPQISQYIYNNLNSSNKVIFQMNNSGHVMLLDKEFDQIAKLTLDFLNSSKIL